MSGFMPIAAILLADFDWNTVGDYLFDDIFFEAARNTLVLSVCAQLIAIVIGILVAVPRHLKIPVVSQLVTVYIWFFRGTPLLLQLLFWYAAVPLYAPDDFGWGIFQYNKDWLLLSSFQAALIALAVNEGAYMAEIARSGIQSIESGQMDAAKALGMRNLQAMRLVILPQAIRVMVPPTGNEFNAMLKNSSLASVIAYSELLYTARGVYARNFQVLELLVVASIWYLFFTTVWTVIQDEIEARLQPEQHRVGLLTRIGRTISSSPRWFGSDTGRAR
jgi:polar amino acid transport system permease protein